MPRPVRLLIASALSGLAMAVLGAGLPAASVSVESTDDFRPRLVTVDTPDRAAKRTLQSLGLDLTEHAGHDYVEVVLHSSDDVLALEGAGFDYDVRIADMLLREAEINQINDQYAASTATSPLPSGRTAYRSLADYNAELHQLAADHPDLVELFELTEPTLDGRTTYGIEIAADVAAEDGRPTFAMFGLHHAREWPSGEHTMEFAHELVNGWVAGNARITGLLEEGRMVIVPVANPDGFHLSYTDGQLVDLRDLNEIDPLDGTTSILATPGNAYKRKNCRVVDGEDTPDGSCAVFSATSPGGFGVGVDTNRNYGGLWGGPGAASEFVDPTYRGAEPFSEPETRNIQELISSRQVTMMISNHTFSNLVLRPNGVHPDTIGPDGHPVGDPPDEEAMKQIGADFADQNGYQNIHGWQLYDTTGTTEDWSYNATGGYGFTFEIGPHEFHPPFPDVVEEYLGAGEYAGRGNREAYLRAFEHALDREHHAVLTGKAPEGATLRLTKTFETPTWDPADDFVETLESSMVAGAQQFSWDVNPSTRPIVAEKQQQVLDGDPVREEVFIGAPAPLTMSTEHEFVVTESGLAALKVDLDWSTPDDLDLYVHKVEADGSRTEVASSGNVPGEKESALVSDPVPATYILEVVNYASAATEYTLTAGLYDAEIEYVGGLVESWTLTCEKDGEVLQTTQVRVDRGEQTKVNLKECRRRY